MTPTPARLRAWLGPVPGAIRGYLSRVEVRRVLIAALYFGALAGSIDATLQYLDVPGNLEALAGPENAALAGALLAVAFEVRRRLAHETPAPPPPLGPDPGPETAPKATPIP